jgi:hypothetical protein
MTYSKVFNAVHRLSLMMRGMTCRHSSLAPIDTESNNYTTCQYNIVILLIHYR